MLTVVVARYQEDVSWVSMIHANVVVVDKAQVGNMGREAASYLWFIANHYDSLKGDYVFCQGDPFAHCPDFDVAVGKRRHYGPRLKCDWMGRPHHPGLLIPQMVESINAFRELKFELPPEIEFTAGAQFMTTAEAIRAAFKPGEAHWLYSLATSPVQLEAAWVFERLWDYIIPTEMVIRERGSGLL
jgi:hypothetical protein